MELQIPPSPRRAHMALKAASFPRMRESTQCSKDGVTHIDVIPAHAGIHFVQRGTESADLCHSRACRNPLLPHTPGFRVKPGMTLWAGIIERLMAVTVILICAYPATVLDPGGDDLANTDFCRVLTVLRPCARLAKPWAAAAPRLVKNSCRSRHGGARMRCL